ncbi:MAG: ABC transporter ATP-binding protein [Bryobacteraceae bacterium]
MSLFELDNVGYWYDRHQALDSVTLRVESGERVALLGANGCGKSTLLRILDGLYIADSGRVQFQGTVLDEHNLSHPTFSYEFRRQVALLFQNPDVQLFNPTVFDEVAFGPLQLRWPRERILEKVEEMLQRLGITELKDRAPHRLSGGEKKRVALASVLVLDPAVLLLDEPTAALDPRSQTQFVDLLRSLDHGRTVITATHDLDTVEDIADRCLVMQCGQIIAEGSPRQILADADLLERVNLVHAHRHAH